MGWVIFLVQIVVILGVFYINIKELTSCGSLLNQFVWLALFGGYIIYNTKKQAPEKQLHMHHYVVGFMMCTFIGYQSVPMALVHGFCTGMMIEGGCRWGFDPIWEPPEQDPTSDDQVVLKPGEEHTHSTADRVRWNEIKAHQSEKRQQQEQAFSEAYKAAPQNYFCAAQQPQQ